MAREVQVFHADRPVRRTWASKTAAALAIAVGIAVLVIHLVPRFSKGLDEEVTMSRLLLLGLICMVLGSASAFFAFVAIVRDRGSSRVGASFLLADAMVQPLFWLIGTSSTEMNDLADSIFNWAWASTSLVMALVGCVLIFLPARALTRHRSS